MDDQTGRIDTEELTGEAGSDALEGQGAAKASGTPVITQVAQAAVETIPTPGEGERVVIEVIPGTEYVFAVPLSEIEFVLVEGNLVGLVSGGGEIVLSGWVDAVAQGIPELNFAGETVAALDLTLQTATPEQLAEIMPALGPALGLVPNTGAAFSPYDPGNLPPGLEDLGPLGPTELGFGRPLPELHTFPGEAEEAPPPSPLLTVTTETIVTDGVNATRVPAGAYEGAGFEDGQPNQHVGDDSVFPIQLMIEFTPQNAQVLTSVTISDIPDGVRVFVGGLGPSFEILDRPVVVDPADIGNVFLLLPPNDSDADFPLTVTANFEQNGTPGSVSTTTTVIVDAVADLPTVGSDGGGVLDQGTPVEVPISASFGDFTDGSETHTLVISNVPGEWTLTSSGGLAVTSEAGPGGTTTYTVAVVGGSVSGTLVFSPGSFLGTANLTIQAIAQETNLSGGELTTINNIAIASDTFQVTLEEEIVPPPPPPPDNVPTFTAADNVTVDEDGLPAGIGDNAPGDFVDPDLDGDGDEATATGTLTYDAGADGFGSLTFDVTNGDPVLDTGASAVKSGGVALKYLVSGGGTVLTAVTDDVNETPIFTVTLTSITATGADYDVVLLGPVDHPVADTEDDITVELSVTVTDTDGDPASKTFQITIDDDSPVVNSVMDAIVASEPGLMFTGLYDAAFGADGLEVLSLALRNSGFFGDTAVTFDQTADTPTTGVTQVEVRDAGTSDLIFTFFYTVDPDPVSLGGDGNVELEAFFDSADPAGSSFFTLKINPDETYDFTLHDNEFQVVVTTDFGNIGGSHGNLFITAGEVSTTEPAGGADILITGDGIGPQDTVNSANAGLGVGNANIDAGEKAFFDFLKVNQTAVSFNVTSWAGNPDQVNLRLTFMLGATLVATQDIFVSTTANADVPIVVQQGLVDPVVGDTTVIINGAFDMMTVEYLDVAGSNSTGIRIDNFEYTSSISVEDFVMNFQLDAKDGDGDTFTLTTDDLTIAIVDGDVEEGLNLSATDPDLLAKNIDGSDGVVIAGGSGPDTITGGLGDDILIGRGDGDTLTGGTSGTPKDAAVDTFVYEKNTSLALQAEGGDTINGFETTVSGDSVNDIIDISKVLSGGDSTFAGSTFSDATTGGFLTFNDTGSDVEVKVDLDGTAGGTFSPVTIATLVGVGDVSDLTAANFIVA